MVLAPCVSTAPVPPPAPAARGLVRDHRGGHVDLCGHPRRRLGCPASRSPGPHLLAQTRPRPYLGGPARMSYAIPSNGVSTQDVLHRFTLG